MKIVSLTTDFGTSDYYVALLKASILKRAPNLQIVDISHSVSTHDIVEGAFFLSNCYKHFPEGTIHVVAIQNYYARNSVFIAFEKNGHFFIGPNNGIFSLIFEDVPEDIYIVNLEMDQKSFLQSLISHAVGCIAHGLGLEELGPPLEQFETKLVLKPVTTGTQIRATIIHVDHFGNVIVNLTKELFEKMRKGRAFEIYYKSKDPIKWISNYYSDVPIGDVLCMFNAAGYLEIAINMGNAHMMLDLKKNETIQINFK